MLPAATDSECTGSVILRGRVGWGVRCAFSRFYPAYVSEDDLFVQQCAPYIRRDATVLDAGCGKGIYFSYPWKQQVKSLIGCDFAEEVHENHNVDCGLRADLTSLPFANNSFDLIFSRYVLEHLDRPESVFAEFARILKPGGKLIVLTPSKHHYVALISRMTPHWFHEAVSTLRGNPAHDVFPTWYRANSKAALLQYARQVRLSLNKFVTREVCPNYLLWSLPSFLFGVAYERVVNRFPWLSPVRVSIIAVFER